MSWHNELVLTSDDTPAVINKGDLVIQFAWKHPRLTSALTAFAIVGLPFFIGIGLGAWIF